jgi:hypothetical protein
MLGGELFRTLLRCCFAMTLLSNCRAFQESTHLALLISATSHLVRLIDPVLQAYTDSIVLFPRHLQAARRDEVISHIQTFRDYFHYHIKASKAFIHSRMRKRTADFLQGMSSIDVPRMDQLLITLQSSGEQGPRRRRRSARQLVDVHSGYRHKCTSRGVVIRPKSKQSHTKKYTACKTQCDMSYIS